MSTYARRSKAEAFDNVVDVVELLLDPTDQAPNIQHLRVLHMFSSMTIPGLRSDKVSGMSSVSTTAWCGDGEVIRAGLRLSTMKI